MRIIILGARGQIGNVLYKMLKENHEVIGTSRIKVPGLLEFNPFKDTWSVLGKADIIINCIGQIYESVGNSFEMIHVELTSLIVKNRKLLGEPRIIQLSALGASELNSVSFLRAKGKADSLLIKQCNSVILRPSIVCTPQTMLVKKIKMLGLISGFFFKHVFLPKNFKEHRIQPVMPEDLATIVESLCLANSIPPIIEVAGPDKISFEELINSLFKSRNERYNIIELPHWVFEPLVRVIDKINKKIISMDQYQLLFSDNITDKKLSEKYLGKPMSSTKRFWIGEFKK